MKASVTFERDIEELPKSCNVCPFCDICGNAMWGIFKKGGMEFTVAATRRRVPECPIKVETPAPQAETPPHRAGRVSPKEFATMWGVDRVTIYRALKAGQIPGATKVRSQWRIPADATFS